MKYEIGAYVHICARGMRKLPIVQDDRDRWHFLDTLYYLNNNSSRRNLFQELKEKRAEEHSLSRFFWPKGWAPKEPIVDVINHSLAENHFHLLLRERTENGIPRFMQKMKTSMAKHYNEKYKTSGHLFQGRYRAKVVDNDEYLAYLSAYIQVKNILELYPGGLQKALKEFDKAFKWAVNYPFGSLGDFAGMRNSPIVEKGVLGEIFPSAKHYQDFAKECILGMNLEERIGPLTLE